MKDIYPVYKLIDGKRVLMPDGRREGRRYGQIVDKDEIYMLEYTDEQEKEADAQAEKWKAEEPQRLAEKKRQQEEYEKFKSSLVYENRIIAFLDIMGWSEAIKNSINDPSFTTQLGIGVDFINKHIEMARWQQEHQFPYDYQISHFSDSIIISTNCEQFSFDHISAQVHWIIQYFLSMKLPIRGAITIGKLIHRQSMVYGPALVRAYELEKDVAIWPRVILDEPITMSVPENITVSDQSGKILNIIKRWDTDNDGWAFIDYLKSQFGFIEDNSPSSHQKTLLTQARVLITEKLSEYKKNSRTHSKYLWMALYFNRVLSRYPDIGIKAI
jgi:hypothetical protein